MPDERTEFGDQGRQLALVYRRDSGNERRLRFSLWSLSMSPPRRKLPDYVAEARSNGWSVAEGDIESALRAVTAAGCVVVPTRPGHGPVGVLEAVAPSEAHAHSLSAQYGRGALPLHTDGAHLAIPPNLVMLSADTMESSATTALYKIRIKALSRKIESCLRKGVFVVRRGQSPFYAHALSDHDVIRYDPGCMSPIDGVARYAADWFREESCNAFHHTWDSPNRLLVIDNAGVAHGRSRVAEGERRTLRRLMVHWEAP